MHTFIYGSKREEGEMQLEELRFGFLVSYAGIIQIRYNGIHHW
jgi:hypothetical protein